MTSEQRAVTPADLDMLDYFWTQKKDVERYCDWGAIQVDLEKRFPEIAAAWRGYIAASRTLTAVIKQACAEHPRSDT